MNFSESSSLLANGHIWIEIICPAVKKMNGFHPVYDCHSLSLKSRCDRLCSTIIKGLTNVTTCRKMFSRMKFFKEEKLKLEKILKRRRQN
jgi:uncharacterized Fe-S cluster-containing protein